MKIRKMPRILTPQERQVLKLLWKWKVANLMTIKTILASGSSFWTVYDWILKLKNEGYISSTGGSDWYPPVVWQLTKKGFDACLADVGELSELRFKPHSVPHDAWVLAFQLGDFVHGVPDFVTICTEQQFRSFDQSLHPKCFPKDKSHIPDGFTGIKSGDRTIVYGIEVELNAKPIERYDAVFNYYEDETSISNVLWLVGTPYVKSRMIERLAQIDVSRKGIHNFIHLEDFKKNGWDSVINHGQLLNQSIKRLMFPTAVLPRSNDGATSMQPSSIDVFLSTKRSPRKSAACADAASAP